MLPSRSSLKIKLCLKQPELLLLFSYAVEIHLTTVSDQTSAEIKENSAHVLG